MNAGKVASLMLAGMFGAIATILVVVAQHVPSVHNDLHTSTIFFQCMRLFGLLSLLFLALLFPIGSSVDRAICRLGTTIERDAGKDIGPRLSGPRWLQPLVNAIAAAIDSFREDRRRLREDLLHAETRHSDAESHLLRSEAVLQTLRDAVIVTDSQNRVVMINETAAQNFGIEVDRALPRPVDEVLPSPQLCDLIRDIRESGEFRTVRHEEIRLPVMLPVGDATPKIATLDACFMCVEQQDGQVGGVVVILHDLTPQHELSDLKTDFVSKASHELRTPLSSIRAYVEMLIDDEAKDEASRQQFYRIIQEETVRLSQLIENMLNISRIEAGMVQIETQPVNLKALIEQVCLVMEPQANEKNLTLSREIESDQLTAEVDRDMLFQVIFNLISNAVKYTPQGGHITVSAKPDHHTHGVNIAVTDTGLGIPEDSQSRIFEKFYRVEHHQQIAKGTGLGLTLCKHIVENVHHGHIGVESRVGMGAKFWISIPIHYESNRAAA